MKRITLSILTLVLFLGLNNAMAQRDDIVVNEIIEYMSQGEKTGFEVAIVDADPKDVQSSFSKFLNKVCHSFFARYVCPSKRSISDLIICWV